MQNIVVAGATGQTGLAICDRLLRSGYGIHATCRYLDEAAVAFRERYKAEPVQLDQVNIRRVDEVREFYERIASAKVVGLVNAVKFTSYSTDHLTYTDIYETNVIGFFYLVDEFLRCRWSAFGHDPEDVLRVVDIADDDEKGNCELYAAAMQARRSLGKSLQARFPAQLRLKTIIRSPSDTPEKIADYVEFALLGTGAKFVGELTPSQEDPRM